MKIEAREIEKRVNGFIEYCRRYGIKATHQRLVIYRELAGRNGHPDAETVYAQVRKRIPEISLDTVYRTLRLLERKGLISRVGPFGDKTRFDANTHRHHHFVCTRCGLMGDYYNKGWNDVRVPKDVATLGKVESVHVELRGLCKACQGKQFKKR